MLNQNNHQEKVSRTTLPTPFLTGYFVGGHPTPEKSIELIVKAVQAGVDVVEIGIPSKDPFLDGDIIRHTHKEVFPSFYKKEHYCSYLKKLREQINIPIWVMGYYTDLMKQDLYLHLADYVDGFVMPDISLENINVIEPKLTKAKAIIVPVINDSMNDKEIVQRSKNKSVLYCQLYKGKTGKSITNTENFPLLKQRVERLSNAKLMGGFGINSGKLAQSVYESGYDGVVVGSEIVRLIHNEDERAFINFIKELARSKRGE